MKNKFSNPYEDKKPKKTGRLAQLSKSNRKLKAKIPEGLSNLEMDWIYEKKNGVVSSVLR